VDITNLHPISHRFGYIGGLLVQFSLSTRVASFKALVRDAVHHSGLRTCLKPYCVSVAPPCVCRYNAGRWLLVPAASSV